MGARVEVGRRGGEEERGDPRASRVATAHDKQEWGDLMLARTTSFIEGASGSARVRRASPWWFEERDRRERSCEARSAQGSHYLSEASHRWILLQYCLCQSDLASNTVLSASASRRAQVQEVDGSAGLVSCEGLAARRVRVPVENALLQPNQLQSCR